MRRPWVKMDFAFFAIAFNIKKMVAKMTNGGLFSYLRIYLNHITPYKLFTRLLFVEKQKLVVHPHKNVQRVFLFILGVLTRPLYFYPGRCPTLYTHLWQFATSHICRRNCQVLFWKLYILDVIGCCSLTMLRVLQQSMLSMAVSLLWKDSSASMFCHSPW